MKHAVTHDLSPDLARKATDRAFQAYKDQYGKYKPEAKWVTPERCEVKFTVKGMTLEGALELKPKAIEMDLDVPFVFRVFKSQAIGVIEKEIQHWIGKAKKGEL